MHDTYNKDRHRRQSSDIEQDPNLAALDTKESEESPTLTMFRKVWAPDLETKNDNPNWQRVVLIQDNTETLNPLATGFDNTGARVFFDMNENYNHNLCSYYVDISNFFACTTRAHMVLGVAAHQTRHRQPLPV